MSKIELKPHPKLSYGNHKDDDKLVVIRVDEGVYEGTVFSYSDIDASDENLSYRAEFHAFFHLGQEYNEEPEKEIVNGFYESVASPFLHNALVAAAEEKAEQ
jgi:hypothetical protein